MEIRIPGSLHRPMKACTLLNKKIGGANVVVQNVTLSKLRLLGAIFCAIVSLPAYSANKPLPQGREAAPCALVERFDGDVQVLSSDRNILIPTFVNSPVPCGAWITVRSGWAEFKHREGQTFRLGPDTFLEVHDPEANPKGGGSDQLLVYGGRVWFQTPGGTHSFQVETANGRAVLPRGTAIVSYNANEEETQLVVAEDHGYLMNRFLTSRPVQVKAGEVSTLNLKLQRVVPAASAAIDLASVKQLLSGMPSTARENQLVLAAVQKRADRKVISLQGDRKIASSQPKRDFDRYERYPTRAHSAAPGVKGRQPSSRWMGHLTGEVSGSQQLLFPRSIKGNPRAKVRFEDPGLAMDRKLLKEEEAEKKQILEELSRVQAE
jgi:hypothetical protein